MCLATVSGGEPRRRRQRRSSVSQLAASEQDAGALFGRSSYFMVEYLVVGRGELVGSWSRRCVVVGSVLVVYCERA